jgi:hypothetical protein
VDEVREVLVFLQSFDQGDTLHGGQDIISRHLDGGLHRQSSPVEKRLRLLQFGLNHPEGL